MIEPPTEHPEDDKLRALRKAWHDGIDSGNAGEIDFAALKLEARGRRRFRTEQLSDKQSERIASSRMDPRHDDLDKLPRS